MSSHKLLTAGLLMALFFACSPTPSASHLKKETFSKVLAEMLTLQYLKIDKKEKAILARNILKKYHITRAQFDSTKAFYAQKPDFWVDTFKRVKKYLDRELQSTSVRQKTKK